MNTLFKNSNSTMLNGANAQQHQFTVEDKPVYTNKDLMYLLGIKSERLRKFRDNGYLGYVRYPCSDKIWYTKKNLEDFLNNPIAQYQAWK